MEADVVVILRCPKFEFSLAVVLAGRIKIVTIDRPATHRHKDVIELFEIEVAHSRPLKRLALSMGTVPLSCDAVGYD